MAPEQEKVAMIPPSFIFIMATLFRSLYALVAFSSFLNFGDTKIVLFI